MEISTKSAQETKSLGQKIGSHLKSLLVHREDIVVMTLAGELGSGKTTFVQGFAHGLGIGGRLLSPTYTFLHTYPIPHTQWQLLHYDFYRLSNVGQLAELGFSENLTQKRSIIIIEWPERIGDRKMSDWVNLVFKSQFPTEHNITITGIEKVMPNFIYE